jgi:DNA modification methylase
VSKNGKITWVTETRRLGDLEPWPENPRQLTEAQAERLEHSLTKFGYSQLVEIEPDGTFLDGHQRDELMRVMEDYGADAQIEVRVASRKFTLAERKEYIAQKHQGATGEWDVDQMHNLYDFDELVDYGFDVSELEAWGFAPDEEEPEDDPGAQIDRAEELREKWGVETGQLWRLGEHRLICGDSLNEEDTRRLFGDERAVLFATDPPYGINYNSAELHMNKTDYEPIAQDQFHDENLQIFLEGVFRNWADNALVDNAAWYLWHAHLTQGFFAAAAAAAANVILHRQIIWVKPQLIFGRGDYHWKHEPCFYGWREGNRPPWKSDRKQVTVWVLDYEGNRNDRLHPTEKPTQLFEIPMRNHAQRGEICAEPFCGSGSQIIAGERAGMRVYACEIEPKFVAVAIQRWVDMTGGEPILLEDGV